MDVHTKSSLRSAAVKPARVVALASVLFASTSPSFGAAGAEGTHRCAVVAGDAARLACYDQAFGRPDSNAKPGVAEAPAVQALPVTAAAANETPVAAVPSAAAAAQAREEFGLSEAAKRARDPEKARETMPQSITTVVAKVVRRPTGESIVTLENEQVWEQAEPGTTVLLKAGDSVTIRKAALGSYVLVTPSRAAVRVRRVR
jgi:hypothetical protein